jgi:hypothetical protein
MKVFNNASAWGKGFSETYKGWVMIPRRQYVGTISYVLEQSMVFPNGSAGFKWCPTSPRRSGQAKRVWNAMEYVETLVFKAAGITGRRC